MTDSPNLLHCFTSRPNGSAAMSTLSKTRKVTLLEVLFLALMCGAALSQEPLSTSELSGTQGPTLSSSASPEMAFPADRIIELLREKPELLIELKKVAAERLQAQGVDVQEDFDHRRTSV